MRAILIFYLTSSVAKGGLGFADSKAGAIYGLYASMVYLMCLAGGWIADRVIGQRRAVLIGGIFIACGQFCLVVPSESAFYLGLILLVCGTGLLKGNVSTIVGQLYHQGDPRRDSGFSLFYMGINIGALIAPLICGYVGERISWRLGFGWRDLACFESSNTSLPAAIWARRACTLPPPEILTEICARRRVRFEPWASARRSWQSWLRLA
jgi:POT family proton-dependent oligopeptide transporter